MQAGQCFRHSLVVPGHTTKARRPRETALDDLAARQQHQPVPGLEPSHPCALDAPGGCTLGGLLAGAALVHNGHRRRVARAPWHPCGLLLSLRVPSNAGP
jgi:hypothetical protein